MQSDAKPYVVGEYFYYPMDSAPLGKKVLALTEGKTCVVAVFTTATLCDYHGWFPLPRERKHEEFQLTTQQG